MTQEEITEFWRTQTVISMGDLDEKRFVKPQSMERIAKQYGIELVTGKIYTFEEASKIITAAEIRKRQVLAQEEQTASVENKPKTYVEVVVAFFELLKKSNKQDTVRFVSDQLTERLQGVPIADIKRGIEIASERGLTTKGEEIFNEYQFKRSAKVLKNNIEVAAKRLENHQDTEEQVANKIANFIYQNFRMHRNDALFGILYSDIKESNLPENVQQKIIDCFYERFLTPDIEKYCRETKYRGNLLAKDILRIYGGCFDLERVVAIIECSKIPNLNAEKLRYDIYCLDDEELVKKSLTRMSRDQLSAVEIVKEIKAEKLPYPISYVVSTIEKMQSAGLVLPYEGIYAILAPEKQKNKPSEIETTLRNASKEKRSIEEIVAELGRLQEKYSKEEIIKTIHDMQRGGLVLAGSYEDLYASLKQKEEEMGLVPVEHKMATLDLESEEFIESQEIATLHHNDEIIEADFEPISTGKRHTVMKREKAKSSLDKKAVVAAILVALGAASTAVLSSVFGVNPLSAARNTVTSIMSVASRNPALAQVLPAVGDFVKNLSLFGMAATGTIAWLKRRKKQKTEQRKREIAEVLEELMHEKEEAERGGKTR